MNWWDLYGKGLVILLIIAAVIAILVFVFFKVKKRIQKKIDDQQTLVDQHKVPATILVLEKFMGKINEANIPKGVIDQIPKIYKIKKVPIVKAKIGSQIMDLMCDEKIFDKIPLRKSVKIDLAGIFIAGIHPPKK